MLSFCAAIPMRRPSYLALPLDKGRGSSLSIMLWSETKVTRLQRLCGTLPQFGDWFAHGQALYTTIHPSNETVR